MTRRAQRAESLFSVNRVDIACLCFQMLRIFTRPSSFKIRRQTYATIRCMQACNSKELEVNYASEQMFQVQIFGRKHVMSRLLDVDCCEMSGK